MSESSELIKLQAMFYHLREPKHVRFLQNSEPYAWWRTLNTFKGGKTVINGQTIVSLTD